MIDDKRMVCIVPTPSIGNCARATPNAIVRLAVLANMLIFEVCHLLLLFLSQDLLHPGFDTQESENR